MKTINEKLGIKIDYSMENGKYEKAFFYSANDIELNAFCMDDIDEYQDQIEEEINVLTNAKTKADLEKYINGYTSYQTTCKICCDYILDFNEFEIRVLNN